MVDKVKANEYSKVCVQWNSSNMNWERKQSKQQDKDKVRCGDGSYESLMHNNINHTCRRWKFIYCVSCILAHECLPQANESDKKKRQQQNERVMKMAMSKCSKTKWAKDKATATKEPKIKWKREKKKLSDAKAKQSLLWIELPLICCHHLSKICCFRLPQFSTAIFFSLTESFDCTRTHTYTHIQATNERRKRKISARNNLILIFEQLLRTANDESKMKCKKCSRKKNK